MNNFDYRKCGEVAKWLTNIDSEGSSDEEFIYTLALYEQLRKADSNERPDEKLEQLYAKDPGVIIRDFNSDEFLDNLENTVSNCQLMYQGEGSEDKRKMKTIEISFEKTISDSKIIEVTDSVFEEIERMRRLPDDLYNKMKEIVDDPDRYYYVVYNYAVVDMDNPKESVIDWDD